MFSALLWRQLWSTEGILNGQAVGWQPGCDFRLWQNFSCCRLSDIRQWRRLSRDLASLVSLEWLLVTICNC